MTDPTTPTEERWLGPGVAGIGTASLLADVGHEIPTALLPSLLTATLGAPASALGLIEGIADGLAGAARLAGGALADDPRRRRTLAVGGYTTTAVLSSLIGAATTVWQVGVLRAGAWAARGLRVPARNALLADIVPATVYGRAYGLERAMDNLGAIAGPLLALVLVGLVGVRTAIALSIIPGLLAAAAIVYAIHHTPRAEKRERQPLRLRVRPVLVGRLGRLMIGVSAFEFGNVAATLLILRATELLAPGHSQDRATQLALGLYVAYNVAATLASVPPASSATVKVPSWSWPSASDYSGWPMPASPPAPPASWPWRPGSLPPGSRLAVWRRPSMPLSPLWPRPSCVGRRLGCWRQCRASATWPPAPSPACSGPPSPRGWPSATWSPGCCWPWWGYCLRPAALGELMAAEVVAHADEDNQQRWLALPTARNPLLEAVDLHGAHDFRHTFATWLEDAGIPARVIDEVMGHEATSRAGQQRGSAMGAHYRHTTPEMAARIAAAIEQRLRLVLEVAEQALAADPSCSSQRVF